MCFLQVMKGAEWVPEARLPYGKARRSMSRRREENGRIPPLTSWRKYKGRATSSPLMGLPQQTNQSKFNVLDTSSLFIFLVIYILQSLLPSVIMSGRLAFLTLSLAAVAAALPAGSPMAKRVSDTYTYYTGDGSTAAGWPSESDWGSFDDLWSANVPLMQESCGNNGWGADDSTTEVDDIKNAIISISGQTGVDERVILAIIMQESEGCVRVPTTDNGVSNPGLMQSHDGSGTCAGVDPCPQSEITQMVNDGTAGTSSGSGIEQLYAQTSSYLGAQDAQAYYAAARLYNSGSVNYSNLDDGFSSTPCYACDVANRLTGWTLAESTCTA